MGRELRPGTRVVRSARSLPDGDGVPVTPPLIQSVAFDYDSAARQDEVFGNERPGYVYGRYGTPTTAALETPVLVRPASLGADVVIHSLTKYVNGHGDVMGGSVAGGADVAKAMRDRTILDGAYLPPHEAWLCIRGMRTLELRMRRQCESALRIASHLGSYAKITRVSYPGPASPPLH